MRKTFKAISITGFILSAIFTVALWISSSANLGMQLVLCCVALTIEASKLSLAYVAINGEIDGHEVKDILRWAAAIGAVLCFCISIVASLSLLANNSSESEQVNKEESSAYNARLDQIKIQEELCNTKKAEIAALQKQADSWPANYCSKRQETLNQKAEKEKEYDTLGAKLLELKDMSTVKPEEVTTGFRGLCTRICKSLNTSRNFRKNPLTPADVEYYFFAGCALLFDLISLLAYLLSSKLVHRNKVEIVSINAIEPNAIEPNTKKQNDIKDQLNQELERLLKQYKNFPGEVCEKESVKAIGFKYVPSPTPVIYNSTEFNDAHLKTYLDFMYNNREGQKAPGTDQFKNKTQLKPKQIKGIRYYLEQMHIVETNPTRTNILVDDLNQAKEILGLK